MGRGFVGYSRIVTYLEGLNDSQKRAVLATKGPVSVLAGAGSGKTRVLTTRIYHLIRQGVTPESILAVTFTNKAAREMRERVRNMLGHEPVANSRPSTTSGLPFVATFHGLGRELLERYGRVIGVPRFFSVYDRDDSEKLIATALKALDVDAKELSPRSVLFRISKAKGEGMTVTEFAERQGRSSFAARVTEQAWRRYEQGLAAEKALDFDDLIAKPVRLLEEHPDVLKEAQARWQYLHVDEYQDTNPLQGRLINLLATVHRNIFVVGDIDQCLVAGTRVSMADGSERLIENVRTGDHVRSSFGSGDMRPARVTRVTSRRVSGALVRITTSSGREIVSTPEHVHFAGYRLGCTPQLHFVYLMYKGSKGWRLGVSQTYTNGQRKPMVGFQQRCNQEHGDAVWVVETHPTPQAARVAEYRLSLAYGIPTLPFIARKGSVGGYVHNQDTLDSIFASFDTERAAARLLTDYHLAFEHPHHRAHVMRSGRRTISMTLCGDRRGASPMHRISFFGSDEEGSRRLRSAGFSVRVAKRGSLAWRFETVRADYGAIADIAVRLQTLFPDAFILRTARLGGHKTSRGDGNALPFLPAASVRIGMALFNGEGGWDTVETAEYLRVTKRQHVYDLDIERTHNFIANGILTHNCIYTWRGATIENLLEFESDYPEAETVVLEHNYRSSANLVDAANAVIEKNVRRKEKRATTTNPAGEPIRIHLATSAEEEARWIAGEAKNLLRAGASPESIAVLFRTNFQSRALEEGFLRAGIPYKLLGTRFFERKEVKDALAWMRLAIAPSRQADKVRAAGAPTRGIGKVTLAKLAVGARETLKAGERAKVFAFEEVISDLAQAAQILTPSEFVKLVIEKSGMRRVLFDEGGEAELERFENVVELATVATRHDSTPGKEGIAAFLAEAALASDQDELDRGETSGVALMTVHAAKGLEFDTVFVAGMEEGLFPHAGMGTNEERDEEEERRLFYVAMTRARHRLILTLARIRTLYGEAYLSEPSSFLVDIDPALRAYDDGHAEDIIEA